MKVEFHISALEHQVLDEAAEQWDETRSAYIREALLQRLERERWITRDVTITHTTDLETGEKHNRVRIDLSNAKPPKEEPES